MSLIDPFKPLICRTDLTAPVYNPWTMTRSDGLSFPEARWERLRAHFDVVPKFLLVGEAPGYQGCAVTGVPFTSERQICSGEIPRIEATARLTTRRLPYSEPSATIMWGILKELEIAERTVMWNAFPWHPHKLDAPMTNRTPTNWECAHYGKPILTGILNACLTVNPECKIIAVGRYAEAYVAAATVTSIQGGGLAARIERVRHPSMGGAQEFRAQMRMLSLGR